MSPKKCLLKSLKVHWYVHMGFMVEWMFSLLMFEHPVLIWMNFRFCKLSYIQVKCMKLEKTSVLCINFVYICGIPEIPLTLNTIPEDITPLYYWWLCSMMGNYIGGDFLFFVKYFVTTNFRKKLLRRMVQHTLLDMEL